MEGRTHADREIGLSLRPQRVHQLIEEKRHTVIGFCRGVHGLGSSGDPLPTTGDDLIAVRGDELVEHPPRILRWRAELVCLELNSSRLLSWRRAISSARPSPLL